MHMTLIRQHLTGWEVVANETVAVLAETPDSVDGKPWDNADYIHDFRVENHGVYLDASVSNRRISGDLTGLTGVSTVKHPWGAALILHGPVRWAGTQIIQPRGLVRMISRYLPFIGASQKVAYECEWPQMVLVLPRQPAD
jgi:hypothetical protein